MSVNKQHRGFTRHHQPDPGGPAVGVESALRVAAPASTACNTAPTQSTHRWASTTHMRGLGVQRRFPGLPSIA